MLRGSIARHSALVLAFATCLTIAPPAAQSRGLSDPTLLGPEAIGYTRATYVRRDPHDGTERRLETVIWYPGELHGEAEDGLGYLNAVVERGRHPTLLYSHGGCAFPEVSTYLSRALASWGFVVVAPSHPGDTIYDGLDVCDLEELLGPTLRDRVDDVRSVVDALERESSQRPSRFFERIDLARLGVLGWSSGGSTAIVAGREDRRFRAVLSLAPDARPERIGTAPLRAATMVMEGELDLYDPTQTALAQVYRNLRAPRFAVNMRRTGHFAFSDYCPGDLESDDCSESALTQEEAHRVVLRFAVPFLLRYAAGITAWADLLQPSSAPSEDADLWADLPRAPRLAIRR